MTESKKLESALGALEDAKAKFLSQKAETETLRNEAKRLKKESGHRVLAGESSRNLGLEIAQAQAAIEVSIEAEAACEVAIKEAEEQVRLARIAHFKANAERLLEDYQTQTAKVAKLLDKIKKLEGTDSIQLTNFADPPSKSNLLAAEYQHTLAQIHRVEGGLKAQPFEMMPIITHLDFQRVQNSIPELKVGHGIGPGVG